MESCLKLLVRGEMEISRTFDEKVTDLKEHVHLKKVLTQA